MYHSAFGYIFPYPKCYYIQKHLVWISKRTFLIKLTQFHFSSVIPFLKITLNFKHIGQARWLMPVIPALWEAKAGWSRGSGDWDQPDQYGEIPTLLKIQKLAGCGGTCLQSQLLGRLRQENLLNQGVGGCTELRWCHCTPAWWQSETLVCGAGDGGRKLLL